MRDSTASRPSSWSEVARQHLGDARFHDGAVFVLCHGMVGALLLPFVDVEVLTNVNPERRVSDEEDPWQWLR